MAPTETAKSSSGDFYLQYLSRSFSVSLCFNFNCFYCSNQSCDDSGCNGIRTCYSLTICQFEISLSCLHVRAHKEMKIWAWDKTKSFLFIFFFLQMSNFLPHLSPVLSRKQFFDKSRKAKVSSYRCRFEIQNCHVCCQRLMEFKMSWY